jgi:peptidoglycan/LPS O-acetylase OafA/YrhL
MGLFRLFLALIVWYDHWRAIVLRPRGLDTLGGLDQLGFNAGYAVMFFYVISGFLITYTLSQNYAQNASGALHFYRNRFVRIFSLYWPMLAVALVLVPGVWSDIANAAGADKLTKIFLLGQDWRVAFAEYPSQHFAATVPGLSQSWTLGAELTFYLMAPLLMRSWKIAACILLASLALRAGFVIMVGDLKSHPIWTYHFAATTICFFMLGHLTCRAAQRFPIMTERVIAVVLMSACIAVMALGSYRGFDSRRFWLSLLCFCGALPALFNLTKDSRILNYISDLSYPTYLVHTLVLVTCSQAILNGVLPYGARATAIAFLGITILFAAMAHHALEIPTAAFMQWTFHRFRRRRSIAP